MTGQPVPAGTGVALPRHQAKVHAITALTLGVVAPHFDARAALERPRHRRQPVASHRDRFRPTPSHRGPSGDAGLAPATVRVHHGIIAGILNDAIKDRRLFANPCADSRLPEVRQRKIEILPTMAVVELHDNIAPQYRALVHTAAASGDLETRVSRSESAVGGRAGL